MSNRARPFQRLVKPAYPPRWFLAPRVVLTDFFFTVGFMWRPSSKGLIVQVGPLQLFIGRAAIKV